MERMTLYEQKCLRCGELQDYVLHSKHSNPGINVDEVVSSYKAHSKRWAHCEECKKETAQEVVSFYNEDWEE